MCEVGGAQSRSDWPSPVLYFCHCTNKSLDLAEVLHVADRWLACVPDCLHMQVVVYKDINGLFLLKRRVEERLFVSGVQLD